MARPAHSRGFTLVELMIVVAVIAVLSAAVVPAVASLSGADARQAAGELGGGLRYLYDTAALRHATCRMALDLTARTWSAECAEGAVGVARGDDAAATSDEELADRLPDERDQERRRLLAKTRFGAFGDRLVTRRELPGTTAIREVRVEGRREPITEGTAYVHFFPGGQAERAWVEVADGDAVYTVVVEPFTGRARVVAGVVEARR
ncbi:MAG: prepilin-type N-terminal cleavage/methylation domain-containing protein [Anaeromyxobacter sp.]|nr:prepilin-type N-terminal cleavage/methylation domain-containing protein [Anaeromyxobacter sp.]